MSWHCSRALAAAFWQADSLVGARSAQSSSTGTDGMSSWPARTTAASTPSRSGTTCEPSTGCPGEGVLTWFREGFPARRIPARLEARTRRMISGRKCGESWQRSLPGTYLPRTSPGEPSTPQPTTSRRWGTRRAAWPFQRQTWVATTFGADIGYVHTPIGYVHTPTATANYACQSIPRRGDQRAATCYVTGGCEMNLKRLFSGPPPLRFTVGDTVYFQRYTENEALASVVVAVDQGKERQPYVISVVSGLHSFTMPAAEHQLWARSIGGRHRHCASISKRGNR